ncbi:MAG: hypothetical protein LQ340_005392 [Diploschistes diacapsis]|nr:MAG: hypothetical protein LQ340_005392 [Diploschistes diacapsis]
MALLLNSIPHLSRAERWQTAFFVTGIFCIKYSWESTSVTGLTVNRFDREALRHHTNAKSFGQYGVLSLLSILFSALGSTFVAPLVKRWPMRLVLGCCGLLQALTGVALLALEAGTGGKIKPGNWDKTHQADNFSYYGEYNPYGLVPLFCLSGFFWGIITTMQKTVPRQIVAPTITKLQFLNAATQTFYEVAAIAGALCSGLLFIPHFGANFPILTPIFAALAGLAWFFLRDTRSSRQADSTEPGIDQATEEVSRAPDEQKARHSGAPNENDSKRAKRTWGDFIPLKSLWQGAGIVCKDRELTWLLITYPLMQYGHSCLENVIAPPIAGRYLGDTSYVQIIVAGSNIGEFLGAIAAMFLQPYIPTPIPWVRLSALMNLLVWILPFWSPPKKPVSAWIVAAVFMPMGAFWSAAAVSLYCYLQTQLSNEAPNDSKMLPPLSSVVAFLHVIQLILSAIAGPVFGAYFDAVVARTGGLGMGGKIQPALIYVGGLQFSVIAGLVCASTFWPRGAIRLNPKLSVPKDEDLS